MDVTKILTMGVSADALAIDLGADFVKVLALQRRGGKIKVLGAGIEKTPTSAIVDGQVMRQDLLIPCVKKAMEGAGFFGGGYIPTIVGLRGVSVVCARLVLPALSEDEMVSQIVMEAQQRISSSLDEWRVDYDVVSPPDASGQVVVMLVGARNAVLSSYAEVLQALHLNLEVVDLDVFAMANAVESVRSEALSGNTLCLDLGRDATRICLINAASPQVVRSVSVCGQDLTASISVKCNISLEEAESLKLSTVQSQGAKITPELRACFENFNTDLCSEIKNTIAFFASSSGASTEVTIDRVFLAGGSARVLGLTEKIASTFGAQVSLMNPFRKMAVSEAAMRTIGADAHRFAIAAGLALRKKNDKDESAKKSAAPSGGGEEVKTVVALPQSSRRLVGMIGGGAALFALITFLGGGFDSPPVAKSTGAIMDETGIPKLTPEQYRLMLEQIEKQEEKLKAEGKTLPPYKQKQMEKLRSMKAQGLF